MQLLDCGVRSKSHEACGASTELSRTIESGLTVAVTCCVPAYGDVTAVSGPWHEYNTGSPATHVPDSFTSCQEGVAEERTADV